MINYRHLWMCYRYRYGLLLKKRRSKRLSLKARRYETSVLILLSFSSIQVNFLGICLCISQLCVKAVAMTGLELEYETQGCSISGTDKGFPLRRPEAVRPTGRGR